MTEQGAAGRKLADAAAGSDVAGVSPADRGRPGGNEAAEDGIDLERLAEAYERGLAREEAGDREGAIAAFAEALTIDPEDRGGVSLRLAQLGAAPTPERCPARHVAMLFSEHAAGFDALLREDLSYRVPELIAARLETLGFSRADHLLDLGCGTGLMAAALEGRYGAATGIDLAPGMLERCRIGGRYARLVLGDAEAALAAGVPGTAPPDLVTAADILPYLGRLDGIMAAVAGALAPGGLFAFSVETLPAEVFGGAPYRVVEGARFAHRLSYLRERVAAAGLVALSADRITVRLQRNAPVPGILMVAGRPG